MEKNLTREALEQELWNMLPDPCKRILEPLKETYIESLMADIDSYCQGKKSGSTVWVKASDRLPTRPDDPGNHYRLNGRKVNGNFYQDDDGMMFFEVRSLVHEPYLIGWKSFQYLEWLDESATPAPLSQSRADLIREANNRDMGDLETEAKEHAKTVTSNPEHQLYIAQGYYNGKTAAGREESEAAELIKVQAEYIQLLSDELYEVVGLIATHGGWQSTRVEQGKRLRERIARLTAEWSGEKEPHWANEFLHPREMVFLNNSDAFRYWAEVVKGFTITRLGNSTGVVLPEGVTQAMIREEWEAYEKANNPAKKEVKP